MRKLQRVSTGYTLDFDHNQGRITFQEKEFRLPDKAGDIGAVNQT